MLQLALGCKHLHHAAEEQRIPLGRLVQHRQEPFVRRSTDETAYQVGLIGQLSPRSGRRPLSRASSANSGRSSGERSASNSRWVPINRMGESLNACAKKRTIWSVARSASCKSSITMTNGSRCATLLSSVATASNSRKRAGSGSIGSEPTRSLWAEPGERSREPARPTAQSQRQAPRSIVQSPAARHMHE